MHPWKYHVITSADMTHLNPLNPVGFDELVGLLDLPEQARILDIACGKGEALIRIASRYTVSGVGVDLCPDFLAAGRMAASGRIAAGSSLSFVEQDGAAYNAPESSIDLISCLGASWVFGGHAGTLHHLARLVRPGGQVMVGEPFWIKEPDPEYLVASNTAREEFGSHFGNAAAGEAAGLTLLYTLVSSPADWDRFEGSRWRAAERYAAAHPDDPDLTAILGRSRRTRDAYLKWGRDSLGWAIYLFRKAE